MIVNGIFLTSLFINHLQMCALLTRKWNPLHFCPTGPNRHTKLTQLYRRPNPTHCVFVGVFAHFVCGTVPALLPNHNAIANGNQEDIMADLVREMAEIIPIIAFCAYLIGYLIVG